MCGIGTDWLKHGQEALEGLTLDHNLHASKSALVIFIKNPALGESDTEQVALDTYGQVSAHTRTLAAQVDVDRWVYYSDYMDEADAWLRADFFKGLQAGENVGARMGNAFVELLGVGYEKVVLIGNDAPDLQVQQLSHAFRGLNFYDYVLGPSTDGGFYLLGMKEMNSALFQSIGWGHAKVFAEALAGMQKDGKTVLVLPELITIAAAKG